MAATDDLLGAFETHSPEDIRVALQRGADPAVPLRGKAPIYWLVEMYTRSPRFAECMRVMLDAGATLDDPYLQAILLDDAERLREILAANPTEIERSLKLRCAYTSMDGVSGLHLCAEYNSVNCARALLDLGIDVDARAEVDDNGLGGQMPIFHAVNSNRNHCRPMMELLVEAGANLDVRLRGLTWGPGYDWETVLFDVTPISYAQCGLYPQFHRREEYVYSNIDFLYRHRYGKEAPARNVPNRYVGKDFDLSAARGGQSSKPDRG